MVLIAALWLVAMLLVGRLRGRQRVRGAALVCASALGALAWPVLQDWRELRAARAWTVGYLHELRAFDERNGRLPTHDEAAAMRARLGGDPSTSDTFTFVELSGGDDTPGRPVLALCVRRGWFRWKHSWYTLESDDTEHRHCFCPS